MKNPFREISTGGMMMLTLTMLTFGSYMIISIFLLLWIPGFIPLESIFILPLMLFVLIFWCCIRSVRFYGSLNKILFKRWLMRHYALNTFLILLISGLIFAVIQNSYLDFSIYWGQFFIIVMIVYLFGILPLPSSFKKSKKAGLYAITSFACVTGGFLLLCLAIKYIITESRNRVGFLFWEGIPLSSLHFGFGWLTGIGLLLLLTAYLLHAGMFSELTGEPLRKIFPKPVFYLTGTAVACHILFLLLCWSATFSLESARMKIQKRFGRYPSAEELSKLYFSGKKPDKTFWDFLEKSLKKPSENKSDLPKRPSDILYDYSAPSRFVVLTDQENRMICDELAKRTFAFAEMDTRINAGIPKYPLCIKKGNLEFLLPPHFTIMRSFCRQTSWRSQMALKAGNRQNAFLLAELTRKMSQYGENEVSHISAIVTIACYQLYFDSLEQLVENHALTREQIRMTAKELFAMEMRLPRMEKDTLFSEAAASEDLTGLLLDPPEENGQVYSVRSLPLFLPQLYWLILLNQTALMESYDVEDFGKIPSSRNIPLKPTMMSKRMFTGASESVHIKFMNLLARSRAERVILACELFRMDTGKYPTSVSELVPKYLDKIPDDPFTGKPLLFRTGELTVEYGKIAKDYYYLQTVPKKIKGLQVWSVGQNGIDNDGIFSSIYGKNEDDPRALIRTQ